MAGNSPQEKFKHCPYCQSVVPELATVCMYCQRDIPRPKNKNNTSITVAFIGVVLLVVVIGAINGESPAVSGSIPRPTFTPTPIVAQLDAAAALPPSTELPAPAPTAEPQAVNRSVLLSMSTRIDGQTLYVQGETDLPDGASISYEYKHETFPLATETLWGDGEAVVQGGAYAAQADLSGWPPGAVEVWVSFMPIGQPAEIIALFGELGERLVGDNVSVSNDGTLRRIEMIQTAIIPGAVGPVANGDANLRSGPGTEYGVVGSVATGVALQVVGRNAAGDWVQLADGNWVAAFLVDGAPGDLPVVEVAAPPTALPDQPAALVAPTSPPAFIQPTTAAPVQAVCECGGDTFNCGNFSTQSQAQACFDYCVSVGVGDIHGLDGSDNDGDVCESLP